jgi:endonuclease/exonuclease/phosphatase family metal-dependent hydrolase
MLLILILAGAAITLQACRQAADESAPSTLRVMSYNIHYGLGVDGEYDLERLARVINEFRPDLVALQEVEIGVARSGRTDQAHELAKLTGLDVRYGPAQTLQGGFFGNAVLSRFPVTDVTIQPLPYTESTDPEKSFPRSAIAVTVEGPGGDPLRIVSAHFMHLYAEDRIAEAEAINRLFAKDGEMTPTIFAADLNAKPLEEPVKLLEQRWTNMMGDPPPFTAPSWRPDVTIDYIFVRPEGAFRLVEMGTVAEPVASDHLPVWAILELNTD